MNGLQAEFHPDEFIRVFLFQLPQQIHDLRGHAVRPCRNGYAGKQRLPQGSPEQPGQFPYRCVCIRICLEITDAQPLQVLRIPFPGQHIPPDLLAMVGQREITAAPFITENAAAPAQCTVPVRAGHAGIQRNLIEFMSERPAAVGRKGIISFPICVLHIFIVSQAARFGNLSGQKISLSVEFSTNRG